MDTVDAQPSFGEALKRYRTRRGLTLRELAGESISTGYLSRLERGERRPSRAAVDYLAHRLGVSVQDLAAGVTADEADAGAGAAGEPEFAMLLAMTASSESLARDQCVEALMDRLDRGGADRAPGNRWQALWLAAEYHGAHGQYATQLTYLEQLRGLSDSLSVPRLQARAYQQLARCQLVLGDPVSALRSAERARELSRGLPESESEPVAALTTLVSVETEAGLFAQAKQHAVELLECAQKAAPALRARATWAAAMSNARSGNPAEACAAMELALCLTDSHEDATTWLRVRLAAVSLYLSVEPPRVEAAVELLTDVKQSLRYIGSARHGQEALLLEARLAFTAGDTAAAQESVDALDAIPEEQLLLGYTDRARITVLKGLLLIAAGQSKQGAQLLAAKAQEAERLGNLDLAASIWRSLALTFTAVDGTTHTTP